MEMWSLFHLKTRIDPVMLAVVMVMVDFLSVHILSNYKYLYEEIILCFALKL